MESSEVGGGVTNTYDPESGEMSIRADVLDEGHYHDYAPTGETIGPPLPSSNISWLWILVAAAGIYLLSRPK